MSHGSEDNILTYNNELISFGEIMAPIKSCPTLLNKPKMFFFHVCRGKNKIDSSRGAQMADHLEINSSSNLQSNQNI